MVNHLEQPLSKLISPVRAGEWWAFKGAPVMGTAYATAMFVNSSLFSLWQTLAFLLVSLAVAASYANLLNDWTDEEEDRLSGKANRLLGRSRLFKITALSCCIIPGLLAAGYLWQSPLLLGTYLGVWAVFTLYSVPPIRLKQRAFWGTLADAAGAHVLPQLFAVVVIAQAANQAVPILWISLIGIWSLTIGLRNIFWHQLADLESDRQASINTFAMSASPLTVQRLGKWVLLPIEIVSCLGILLLSHNIIAWVFLGLYLLTEWLRQRFWQIKIIAVAPSPNSRLFLMEYYELFYPLAFLLTAVWHDPVNFGVLGVHFLLYPQRLWWWLRDLWGLLRWELFEQGLRQHIDS